MAATVEFVPSTIILSKVTNSEACVLKFLTDKKKYWDSVNCDILV